MFSSGQTSRASVIRIRLALLGSMATLALGLVGAPGAAAASPRTLTFGANVATLFPPGQQPFTSAIPALQALANTGATVARADTLWQTAEPEPPQNGVHTYDWSYDDAIATALASAGLQWQPVLDYAAWWAANGNNGVNGGVSPAFVPDYVAYAAAFAERYGPGGTFWQENPQLPQRPVSSFEIWNEEDLQFFWRPTVDLSTYAAMYLQTRAAIKSIDPFAQVIIGGLTRPTSSLPTLVADQPTLRGNVDGVAIHPYLTTVSADEESVIQAVQADEQTVNAPVYINEYGFQPWSGMPQAARDDAITQTTEAFADNPAVVNIDIWCWGCTTSGYDIYGNAGSAAWTRAVSTIDSALAAGGGASQSGAGGGSQGATGQSKHKPKHKNKHKNKHKPEHKRRHHKHVRRRRHRKHG